VLALVGLYADWLQAALALQQQLCKVVARGLGCPTTAVTLDNGACVVHSASTQRLTFVEVSMRVASRPLPRLLRTRCTTLSVYG